MDQMMMRTMIMNPNLMMIVSQVPNLIMMMNHSDSGDDDKAQECMTNLMMTAKLQEWTRLMADMKRAQECTDQPMMKAQWNYMQLILTKMMPSILVIWMRSMDLALDTTTYKIGSQETSCTSTQCSYN
jgi:hypothetical protein